MQPNLMQPNLMQPNLMQPNARRQAPPEAGARDEWRLEAVACTPWLGPALSLCLALAHYSLRPRFYAATVHDTFSFLPWNTVELIYFTLHLTKKALNTFRDCVLSGKVWAVTVRTPCSAASFDHFLDERDTVIRYYPPSPGVRHQSFQG